jgi:hypothetical protein
MYSVKGRVVDQSHRRGLLGRRMDVEVMMIMIRADARRLLDWDAQKKHGPPAC